MKSAIQKFLGLLKYEKNEIGSLYFYVIMNGLIALSLPLGIQSVVNLLFGASISTSLIMLIILIVLGVLLNGWLQMKQMRISEKIQRNTFRKLSFQFAYLIPRFRSEDTDDDYLPELMNRFFDTSSIQKGISKVLIEFPTALVQLIFGILLLSLYHPLFIAFGFFLLIMLSGLIYITAPRGLSTSMEESNYKYEVAYWLEEMSRIARPLKFMNFLNFPINKTDKHVSGYLDSREKHFEVIWTQYYGFITLKTIITALLLSVGTFLLVNESINIGQFVAAEIIILLVLNSIEKMIISLDSVYDLLTAVQKIYKVLDKRTDEEGTEQSVGITSSPFQIELQSFSMKYLSSKNFVLKNIEVKINAGEKICLLGIQGSGCTTFLKTLTGAYDNFEGTFLIQGIPSTNINLNQYRSNISVHLSTNDLFAGTIFDNICMGREASIHQLKEVTDLVGLTPYINRMEEGYETEILSFGRNLPQNITTKILLCRALFNHGRLILLEDSFGKLQKQNRNQIIQYLLNKTPETSVVFSTNDLKVAASFPRCIVLKEGKICYDGSFTNLTETTYFNQTLKNALKNDE